VARGKHIDGGGCATAGRPAPRLPNSIARWKTHNPENERIKRAYFTYLAEAQGFSEPTLDGVAKAMNRFETYTRFRDFKAFHIEQAKGFKASLAEQMSLRTRDHLSKATLYATLSALKRFFIWLAGQPGYKSRISYSDAEYFNLSAKETRIAKARREERVPTLEQIRYVIGVMPASTEIERRDRALVAFTILTGARDRATASLKLKHIDIDQGRVDQDARQVNTKFSKTFTTWFFPVGDDILRIVVDWFNYLRQEKLWGLDDPLFPATKIAIGDSLTTFSSYGEVAVERQREIIRELAQPMDPDPQFEEILRQLVRATKRTAA
jgi:site-specific recombinase XerD